jgi:flagellar motor switch protein FliG
MKYSKGMVKELQGGIGLNALQKVAAFLLILGLEKGRRIMALMDSDELKNVLAEFGKMQELSPSMQESIWREFEQLGYHEEINPGETLYVLRQLFNGSKISNWQGRR